MKKGGSESEDIRLGKSETITHRGVLGDKLVSGKDRDNEG
jgi:hypothetical protein